MKKLVALLAIALMASSAFALVDDGVNSLGVYFDNQVFEANCIDYAPATPFSMYFVLANCSQATMGGFEFGWAFDPDPVGSYFVLATLLPPAALNIGTPNNLIVGLGTPLPTTEATVLVEFQLMILAPGILADITAGPATPASIPGSPAFNDGADPSLLFPMAFSTVDGTDVVVDPDGWVRPGLGTIGCPGPVATENASWSGVKALFQ